MFSAHCNAEGREVLLTTRRISSIEMRDGETEIHFTCWCGHEGVLVDRAVARPGAVADRPTAPRQPARPAA
jgi:hypothetical protein